MKERLGNLIKQAKTIRCGNRKYPVLSMTMHDGLVLQENKFKKEIASKDKSDYKVVYRNQLVISFPIDEGVLAAQRIVDEGIVSPAYGVWDIDQNKILPEFLECALRCDRAIQYYKANLRSSTARRRSLPKQELLAFEVPIPPISEQIEVLNTIHTAKKIIKYQEKELQKLDDLIKSRFIELFGDPETNPFGWERLTLGDLCASIVRGPFGSALKKEFFVAPNNTTYKVYEQKHAIQKSATIGTYYVTAEKFRELRRFECRPGDIIMSCSGTMGELFQLPENCERGIINQALCKFTLNEKVLPIVFLTYMKETIGNLETKGSGIQNIAAVSYVKAMPISLPPMHIQEHFASFVSQIDKLKVEVQKSLDETQLLFDSLMQKYFG